MMMWLIGAVLVVLVMVGFGSGFQTGSNMQTSSTTGSTRSISPRTRSHGKLQVVNLDSKPDHGEPYRVPESVPTIRPHAKIFQMYSRTLDELDAQDPK